MKTTKDWYVRLALLSLAAFGFIVLINETFTATGATQGDWPREFVTQDGKVSVYQPELDFYKGDRIKGRAAISVRNKDAQEPVFGMVWFSGRAITDRDAKMVNFTDMKVDRIKVPQSASEQEKQLTELLKKESANWMPVQMPLDRLLAVTVANEWGKVQASRLNMEPPKIIFTTTPSALILINGKPELRKVENTRFERVINTPFLILFDAGNKTYYTKGGDFWYAATNVMGPWKHLNDPPAPVMEVAQRLTEPQDSKDSDQPRPNVPPEIIVATEPTELIVSEGQPNFAPVQDTDLLYMSNTPSEVFMEVSSQKYYVLLAGRWYESRSLEKGPWAYVLSENLPQDFKRIPPGSAKGHILAFVAGTTEAEEAVLEAQIPQTTAVKRDEAKLSVTYDGNPKFEPIKDTSMHYAVNSKTQVIKVNGRYYAVDQAVWFVSDSPTGPWVVADTIPPEIDTIPPESPVYNVKYVRVYDSTPEVVYVGYTPGYQGSYVYGDTLVYGTGYYYPGWLGTAYYPAPITWGFAPIYDPFYYSWGFGWGYGAGFVSGFLWGFPMGVVVSPWWYGCHWAGWYPWYGYGYGYGYPRGYGYGDHGHGWHSGYHHYPYDGHRGGHHAGDSHQDRHRMYLHSSINRPVNISRPAHRPDRVGPGTTRVPNDQRGGRIIHQQPGQRPDTRPHQASQRRQANLTQHAGPTRETRPGQNMERPREVPRTPDRSNRQQRNNVSSGSGGSVYRRPPQGGEQRVHGGTTRPEARVQTPQTPGRNAPVMGRDRSTQMGRGAASRDFGRVTGGYSGGGNSGRGSPGGAVRSYGHGSPGSGGFRSTPRTGGGAPMGGGSRNGVSHGGGSRGGVSYGGGFGGGHGGGSPR